MSIRSITVATGAFVFAGLPVLAANPNDITNNIAVISGENCYNLTNDKTSFDDTESKQYANPWWGNQNLAEQIGAAFKGQAPSGVNQNWGHMAYEMRNNRDVYAVNAYGEKWHPSLGTPTKSDHVWWMFGVNAGSNMTVVDYMCTSPDVPPSPPSPNPPVPSIIGALIDASPETRNRLMRCLNSKSPYCQFGPLSEALLELPNVTASGGLATQGFVNDLADTVLDQVTQYSVTAKNSSEDEALNERPSYDKTEIMDDGLNKDKNQEQANLIASATSVVDPSQARVWFKGFGGSVNPMKTGGIYNQKVNYYYQDVYNDFYSTHGGIVVGFDKATSSSFRLGAFANYGAINLQQYAGVYAGSGSWSPSGWGGGLTASYSIPGLAIQGLFGATAFAGETSRNVNIPGIFNTTYKAQKNTTSYAGAVRIAIPKQSGALLWEPTLTAIWNGNYDASYSESSGKELRAFGLKVHSYSDNFLQTTLGVKLGLPLKQSKNRLLTPSLKVAWLADWDLNNGPVKYQRAYGRGKWNQVVKIPSAFETQYGVLIEGGVDYSIYSDQSVNWKLYAKGGAKIWFQNEPDWRASGGVSYHF